MPPFVLPLVKFESALDLEWIDGHNWRVIQPFYYDTAVSLRGLPIGPPPEECTRIRVPAGFVTDFASIPRALWSLLPPTGKYGRAAVIHDLLYRTPGLATRGEADRVLLEAAKVCGCGWLVCSTIYAGVRAGGWLSYKGGF